MHTLCLLSNVPELIYSTAVTVILTSACSRNVVIARRCLLIFRLCGLAAFFHHAQVDPVTGLDIPVDEPVGTG
jgi:hypothetical protein